MQFPIDYTLCFLTRADQILLLHRQKPPNQGRWNGVGGRIEPNETPLAGCLREVHEETGFVLETAHFGGVLFWTGIEVPDGGLYIFTAPAPAGDPVSSAEGALCWHPREWVMTAPEVVPNIPYFLPAVLAGDPPRCYSFVYGSDRILEHKVEPLPDWIRV